MQAITNQTQQRVVKFVQELLLDEADRAQVTPALISQKIQEVLRFNPRWREGSTRTQLSTNSSVASVSGSELTRLYETTLATRHG